MNLTRKVLGILGVVVVAVTFFTSIAVAASRGMPVDQQLQICVKGRDLILQRKYVEAQEFLQKVTRDYPEELIGYFGLMALYQIRNLDNFDFRFDADYKPWEEIGRSMALETAKNSETAEPWDLLLAGGTLGISGFYRAHNTKWFAALRDASLGFHTIERAYRKDPKLTEALLGVGLYDYWRSYFTRKLVFLPFFADNREEGREELARAARDSRFASVLAVISLAFIDFQEKNYPKVIAACDQLLNQYPQNTILRMLKGETLLRLKKYSESAKEFQAVLSIDPKLTKSYLYIGLALAWEGKEPAKAKEYLEKFLESEPAAQKNWSKPAFDALKDLQEK